MALKRMFLEDSRLRPAWRAASYLIAYLLASLAIQIPLGILIAVAIISTGGVIDESTLVQLQSSLPLLFLGTMSSLAVIVPLTYLFRRYLDRESWLDLGLRRGTGWISHTIAGLALGTVLIGLIFLAQWALGWLTIEGFRWQVEAPLWVLISLAAYLLNFVAVAFYEELAFRGYVLQNLDLDWATAVALVISSVLFGLFHALNPHATWLALFNIFLAGVVLAACYLATRNLWLAMAFHFSWNFVQGPLLSFPVSGLHMPGLLLTTTGGNPLVTGGAFGPEGGLLGTAVLCLTLPLLYVWRQRASVT